MCRWVAYAGPDLHPSTLILDTPHSLVAQSLHSPLGKETVNGDGFGIGWYPADAAPGRAPTLFRSIEPAWYDENLQELAHAIESPLFFAHVRAASGPPIQQTNCHPFRHQNWMFMHNGVLRQFGVMKRDILLEIEPALFSSIRGTTDSEALFYLAVTFGLAADPIGAMGRAIREVERIGDALSVPHPVQGTFAVTDGSTIWAFRYSSEHRSRTLFYSEDMGALQETYPDIDRLRQYGAGARVIVSEPLSDLPGAFVEVPESTVAVLEDGSYRQEAFLRDA
ncbi:class II glutamine amidotransferase [Herbiconiux sp. CPCC 205763]|uniref:Class II glutamine amidotransferase n=1 Tax=Herbiconiux aconitum TaxID=2970913 RepID=A0ABT2GUV0_9MICO|nr:class II glutamine amidotransferase [Herbiconiux aconitum]MCS5719990.1 class II glutamine amidotransferase [Herbiconiux aconitum]